VSFGLAGFLAGRGNYPKTPAATGVFFCPLSFGEAYPAGPPHPPPHPLPPRCARDDDAACRETVIRFLRIEVSVYTRGPGPTTKDGTNPSSTAVIPNAVRDLGGGSNGAKGPTPRSLALLGMTTSPGVRYTTPCELAESAQNTMPSFPSRFEKLEVPGSNASGVPSQSVSTMTLLIRLTSGTRFL
jgi:hypothetical protein